MLYNEMRPHSFDEMTGQEAAVESIRRQAMEDRFMGVYILYGQYGSGKTTMARILSLAVNCRKDERGNPILTTPEAVRILNGDTADIMEVDGASKNGIEEIRQLVEDTNYRPATLKKKVYIIDEVHMLSKAAFNGLLKTLEEPPEYAVFILCTTDFKAIPATVRSRAACYSFGRISESCIIEKLQEISEKKGYSISEDALALIANNSDGSLRNAESLLEQASVGEAEIDSAKIQKMLGISDPTDLFELLGNIACGEVAEAVERTEHLFAAGKSPEFMISDMLEILSDGVVLSCGGTMELISNTSSYQDMLYKLCKKGTAERFIEMCDGLMQMREMQNKGGNQTVFLVSLIRLTGDFQVRDQKYEELEQRICELEHRTVKPTERMETGSMEETRSEEKVSETATCETGEQNESEQEVCQEEKDTSMMSFMNLDFGVMQLFANGFLEDSNNPFLGAEDPEMDAIMEIEQKDPAFFSALRLGTERIEEEGVVRFRTSLKPVYEMLAKYFEVYGIRSEIVLDVE